MPHIRTLCGVCTLGCERPAPNSPHIKRVKDTSGSPFGTRNTHSGALAERGDRVASTLIEHNDEDDLS
jgi:hypothetical protein